jgi:GntR family transcriptional regulator
MSLYEQTISFILQYIEEHQLEGGARLPPEPELAAMAGVSMVTVRRALAELATQAIVRREQGRGTFVAPRRVSAETTRIGSLRHGLGLDAQSTLETTLLHMELRASSEKERIRLALAQAAPVWEIQRLRLVDGRPMIHELSVIPMNLAPNLAAFFRPLPRQSLYALLETKYGLREAREEQTLVARRVSAAEAKLLQLARQDWVVQISGISYSTRGIPIDSFRMVFDAKSFAFHMQTAATAPMEVVVLESSSDSRPRD